MKYRHYRAAENDSGINNRQYYDLRHIIINKIYQ